MKQRPAAMLALDAAQIDADLALQLQDRPARRDSGAAGHIRPGWWRRPRARRPSARRRAAGAISACAARLDAGSIDRRRASSNASFIGAERVPRRRFARSAARPRWSPAGRSRSSRRPGTGWPSGSRRRRRASCAGVAAKVARFSLTIRQGGNRTGQIVDRGDIAPQQRGQLLAILVHKTIGGADGDGDAIGKGEDPFRRAADHAHHERRCRRAGRSGNAR